MASPKQTLHPIFLKKWMGKIEDPRKLNFFTPPTAYLDFAVTMILSCAVLSEIPVVIFFLTILGLVTAQLLVRHLRYAILIIFVAAAFITPTQDIPTMMVFALPMLALYMVGILVAWIFRRKPQTQ